MTYCVKILCLSWSDVWLQACWTHLKVQRVWFHLSVRTGAATPPSQPPSAPSLRGSEILRWLRKDKGGFNPLLTPLSLSIRDWNLTDLSFWLMLKSGCECVCPFRASVATFEEDYVNIYACKRKQCSGYIVQGGVRSQSSSRKCSKLCFW